MCMIAALRMYDARKRGLRFMPKCSSYCETKIMRQDSNEHSRANRTDAADMSCGTLTQVKGLENDCIMIAGSSRGHRAKMRQHMQPP
jgi:hypothetical protein